MKYTLAKYTHMSLQDEIHLRMKRSELEQYFGVSSHEEGKF